VTETLVTDDIKLFLNLSGDIDSFLKSTGDIYYFLKLTSGTRGPLARALDKILTIKDNIWITLRKVHSLLVFVWCRGRGAMFFVL
jgi:hypothetical protein